MLVDRMGEGSIFINNDRQEEIISINTENTINTTTIDNVNNSSLEIRHEYRDSPIEQVIEVIFNHFSMGLRIIGPLFAFVMIVFILIVVESFFNILLPYWYKKFGIFFAIFITFLCIILLFNVLFNYILCIFVKPGSLEDIKKSKFFKIKQNPYKFNESMHKEIDFSFIFENNNMNIKNYQITDEKENLQINNVQNLESLNRPKFKYCNYCQETKPLRAHHCQICGCCVFKMDHHCPWVNNCIGQNNHRYFILFLTHTLIGCIFISILSSPIFFFNNVKSMPVRFNFISILCITGCILLAFFNSFNWFLVLNGNTTIEYWSNQSGLGANNIIRNFNLYNVSENIFMVFGTKNIIKAIFLPSIKKLPYSGLEWSRFCDPFYKIKEIDEININNFANSNDEYIIENDLLKDIEI